MLVLVVAKANQKVTRVLRTTEQMETYCWAVGVDDQDKILEVMQRRRLLEWEEEEEREKKQSEEVSACSGRK